MSLSEARLTGLLGVESEYPLGQAVFNSVKEP